MCHTAVQPGLKISTDKYPERMILMQNDVSVSADNNTVVPRFSNLPDDFTLTQQKRGTHTVIKANVREAVFIRQLYIVPAVTAQRFLYQFLIHPLVFRKCFNDFLIIIVPAQKIREPLAEFSSSAAKLSADCNNTHDSDLPFPIRCHYNPLFLYSSDVFLSEKPQNPLFSADCTIKRNL